MVIKSNFQGLAFSCSKVLALIYILYIFCGYKLYLYKQKKKKRFKEISFIFYNDRAMVLLNIKKLFQYIQYTFKS